MRSVLTTAAALAVLTIACASATPRTTSSPAAPAATTSKSPSPAASVAAVPGATAAATVFRLVTVEPADSPEGKAVAFFADEVKRLSGGSVTVESASEDGENDQHNIQRVTSGDIAMAIVQARNWDDFGVTTLQALEAPFVITSDALAVDATSGDLAADLMAGLADKGVEGLGLWPIDLRHPVSFGKPFLRPADMNGAKIRIVGSRVTEDVIYALGAKPLRGGEIDDSEFDGAESAFDRAYSLPKAGTFTGNVTFYPRVDLFFVSKKALDRLSPEQRAAVRSGAEATRKYVVDSIVSDVAQAKIYCDQAGGSVALADEAGMQAFASALAPVVADLEQNATTKRLVERIRALQKPEPGEPINAC